MMKLFSIKFLFVVSCFAFLTACNDGDSESESTQPYACGLACLKSEPTLSAVEVSSATGGTVEVTFELDGDLTTIESVFVMFEKVGEKDTLGLAPVWTPTESVNTASITVDAGTPVGEYYPLFTFKHATPDYAGSMYYRDSSLSRGRYSYYEWDNSSSTPYMVAPFDIPTIQVTD